MAEYIEREEAIKKAVGALHRVSHVQAVDIVNAIEEIPAVQVKTEDDIAQKVRERRRRAVTKMMTTEMICKNLRDMLCDPLCKGEMTGNQIEAVGEAINALSAQQEAERNEPLTLDELAAMDGMPVWVEFEPDVTGEQLTMWALIEVTDTIMLTNNLRGRSELLDDMTVEGWRVKVYRRKPKEER